MSNLNGLRQLISLAMRDGHKTVTIPLDNASMIVVEYEKHRVAASDAIAEIENLKADNECLTSAIDEIMEIIDTDAINELTEEESAVCRKMVKAYRAARGSQ